MAKRTCFFSFNFISLLNSLHLFTDAFVFTSFSCCFCVVLFPCPFHTRCFFSHSVGTLTHTQQFELYFTFQFLFTLGSLFRHYKFNAILSFFVRRFIRFHLRFHTLVMYIQFSLIQPTAAAMATTTMTKTTTTQWRPNECHCSPCALKCMKIHWVKVR